LLMPVLALTAGAVLLRMGRPILFAQTRPGLNEKLFVLYKFRTMSSSCGTDGSPLSDAARLTSLGRFLRRWSIDELPQLWNVLKGDMSLVGPRPLLVRYLSRYSPEQRRRHDVKPGITGLAQVSGRNAITWEEKFQLDVWYVDHMGLWLDLGILFSTVLKVSGRIGISQLGRATMDEFIAPSGGQEGTRQAES